MMTNEQMISAINNTQNIYILHTDCNLLMLEVFGVRSLYDLLDETIINTQKRNLLCCFEELRFLTKCSIYDYL